MNVFKTLTPLYYTVQENPQKLEKIMHQSLALMIYDDIQTHQPNLNILMYVQEWLKDGYYHRKSAIQTALLLRKYFRMKKELEKLRLDEKSFWQRQKLGFQLYCLRHQYVSVNDVLNYSCYLFIGYGCGNQEEFIAYLKDILRHPDFYFKF